MEWLYITEHSRLKKAVCKPHPNVYELVEVIKREESITTMKVKQLLAGASLAPKSIDDFLEMVKHLTGL